ncbi:hypothetical protein [Lentiprolixibacter aurantiacus]|uniref:Uncharacterized protein n=1 Tax=Lentiprolixibacter aurantiacus TaxID=2993939 RepID=A0AAE3ML72_9FLAO|nr:hypothetical protein [Lentiprolixibacter aurantiacus]MCX2719346.1 hypothetical protein [Lentiprolixibacter aurantiacus]
MRPKYKALLFNFMAFAIIFLVIRFTLGYFWQANRLLMALASAIAASILSPKFAAIKTISGEKLMMKWIFSKKVHQL